MERTFKPLKVQTVVFFPLFGLKTSFRYKYYNIQVWEGKNAIVHIPLNLLLKRLNIYCW